MGYRFRVPVPQVPGTGRLEPDTGYRIGPDVGGWLRSTEFQSGQSGSGLTVRGGRSAFRHGRDVGVREIGRYTRVASMMPHEFIPPDPVMETLRHRHRPA